MDEEGQAPQIKLGLLKKNVANLLHHEKMRDAILSTLHQVIQNNENHTLSCSIQNLEFQVISAFDIQSWPDPVDKLNYLDDPYYLQNYVAWKNWLFSDYGRMIMQSQTLNAFELRSLFVANYVKICLELTRTAAENIVIQLMDALSQKLHVPPDVVNKIPTFSMKNADVESFLSSELGIGFIMRDRGGAAEENAGIIEFKCITNDRTPESLLKLLALKQIFSKQLPRMPREYITRLTFDRQHYSFLLLKGETVIGGICFRPFFAAKFVEIVFLAVTNIEQVKGYGTRLMNHVKEYLRHRGFEYLLTYADNFALGYFRKQGFTSNISMPKSRWIGRIKDYDGGTLMECYISSKINYLQLSSSFLKQKGYVKKCLNLVNVSEIHSGKLVWKFFFSYSDEFEKENQTDPHTNVTKNQIKNCFYASIPGIIEAGSLIGLKKQNQIEKLSLNDQILHFLEVLCKHEAAWPFLEPVSATEAPDYHEHIKNPMDLGTMKKNAINKIYKTKDQFIVHLKLMFDNCRFYNQKSSIYYKLADDLEQEAMTNFDKITDS